MNIGHVKVVDYLLEKGANITTIDNYNDMPLLKAVKYGMIDMCFFKRDYRECE